MLQTIPFQVTRLAATVPGGVPLEFQGQTYDSGPLQLTLQPNQLSHGQLDYQSRQARAEFHVQLSFPAFASTLRALGVDESLAQPVEADLHSAGPIQPDHGFALQGECRLHPHALFDSSAAAQILPGT